jgi:hypothetical protein
MEKRKKLKAKPISVVKEQEKEVAQKVGRRGNRAGYLDMNKGYNKFRLYPAHPGTESWMYPCVTYFVPNYKEDGKLGVKPVFNSKIHGGTEKDIVEEYVKYLSTETLGHLQGPALDEALKPIIWGGDYSLVPKTDWIAYADKYGKDEKKIGFGRVKFTPGTKNKLEGLASTERSDEPIVLDPFTDQEDGIAIIVTYDPDAKDKNGKKDFKNFYSVELEQKQIDKFRFEYVPTPLTDKEVDEFLKQDSLESMYKKCYKLKDFNLALSGLEIIDEKCKFGVLRDPRFLEIVEEIKGYYPEDDEEEEEEGDELNGLERDGLKKLIIDEFGRGVITVMKTMTDDDIRNAIRLKREELSNVEEEEEEMTEEEDPLEQEEESFDENTEDEQNDLAAMKAAMKNRKK